MKTEELDEEFEQEFSPKSEALQAPATAGDDVEFNTPPGVGCTVTRLITLARGSTTRTQEELQQIKSRSKRMKIKEEALEARDKELQVEKQKLQDEKQAVWKKVHAMLINRDQRISSSTGFETLAKYIQDKFSNWFRNLEDKRDSMNAFRDQLKHKANLVIEQRKRNERERAAIKEHQHQLILQQALTERNRIRKKEMEAITRKKEQTEAWILATEKRGHEILKEIDLHNQNEKRLEDEKQRLADVENELQEKQQELKHNVLKLDEERNHLKLQARKLYHDRTRLEEKEAQNEAWRKQLKVRDEDLRSKETSMDLLQKRLVISQDRHESDLKEYDIKVEELEDKQKELERQISKTDKERNQLKLWATRLDKDRDCLKEAEEQNKAQSQEMHKTQTKMELERLQHKKEIKEKQQELEHLILKVHQERDQLKLQATKLDQDRDCLKAAEAQLEARSKEMHITQKAMERERAEIWMREKDLCVKDMNLKLEQKEFQVNVERLQVERRDYEDKVMRFNKDNLNFQQIKERFEGRLSSLEADKKKVKHLKEFYKKRYDIRSRELKRICVCGGAERQSFMRAAQYLNKYKNQLTSSDMPAHPPSSTQTQLPCVRAMMSRIETFMTRAGNGADVTFD